MQILMFSAYKPPNIVCTSFDHQKPSNADRRRSGNYKPSQWDFDSIQSLTTQYKEEKYLKRASELMEKVRLTLMVDTSDQLELIDDLKKLGISSHFEGEIDQILTSVYDRNKNNGAMEREEEKTLVEAQINWKIERPYVRRYIDAYKTRPDMNPNVLNFAKLNFNIVQATHQQELKHISRWWKSTYLAEKLPFARDRLVECYFWTIGFFEPREYGYQRIMATKIIALITTIDDIFDVHGTPQELQLFNHTIQRWDIESIKELPDYMQICYLALYNFVNEMANDVMKDQGLIITPYLRKSWEDLIGSYLQEAKWYYDGYKPSMEEYLNNAWISISVPTVISQVYFLVANPIKEEAVQSLYKYHDIVRWAATISRLANDLGTSMHEVKRGDVPKSVECYMNEKNVSEKEAQEHVRSMIGETWKKLNKERVSDSPFPKEFIECAFYVARMSQFMYKDGDGHGMQQPKIRDHITSLLFEPYDEM